MNKKSKFNLFLNSEQVLGYYKGHKQSVKTYTTDGLSISIPFDILLEFVTHDGISGTFEIYFKDDGKFRKIVKIK